MASFQEVAVTSCLKDPTISAYVWDIQAGTTLMMYRGDHQVGVNGLSLLAGEYLVAALKDKPFLRVWPINSQQSISGGLRLVCPGRVNLAQVSPDGYYVAVTVGEKIYIYQIASGRLVGTGARHFQPIKVVHWTRSGDEIVCGGEDGIVTVWSLCKLTTTEASPQPRLVFSDHVMPVTDLTVSGGTRPRVYSVSIDRTCKIYDLVAGTLLLNIVFDLPLTSVAVPLLETDLFVGSDSGKICQLNLLSPPRQIEYHVNSSQDTQVLSGHSQRVHCLAVSSSGQHLMSGSMDGDVKLWHIGSRVCVRTIPHKGPITNAFFTAKPKQMFANELKPSVVLTSFQSSNSEVNNCIEVITRQRLTLCDTSEEELFPTESSGSSDARTQSLQMNVDLLRKVNENLYKFTVEKLIEKDSTMSPTPLEIEATEVVSNKKKNKYNPSVNSEKNVSISQPQAVNGSARKKKNKNRRKRRNSSHSQ